MNDLVGADELLPQIEAEAVIADKAYDADERVREILKHGYLKPRIFMF